MTAKEYLGQIQSTIIDIKSMTRQVQSLEDALTGASPQLSATPGAAKANIHRMEKMIVAKVDLERKIEAQSAKLAEIINAINSLPRTVHSAILTSRYVSRMDWRDIANEMRLSVSHLYQLHRDALKEIEKLRSQS
jgi:DNA-directed RNA polymerase specialized sigma subunit